MVGDVVDISNSVRRMVEDRAAKAKNRGYYRAGLEDATKSLLEDMFSDEAIVRASEVIESESDLSAGERMTHALAAALRCRIVALSEETSELVSFDEEVRLPEG